MPTWVLIVIVLSTVSVVYKVIAVGLENKVTVGITDNDLVIGIVPKQKLHGLRLTETAIKHLDIQLDLLLEDTWRCDVQSGQIAWPGWRDSLAQTKVMTTTKPPLYTWQEWQDRLKLLKDTTNYQHPDLGKNDPKLKPVRSYEDRLNNVFGEPQSYCGGRPTAPMPYPVHSLNMNELSLWKCPYCGKSDGGIALHDCFLWRCHQCDYWNSTEHKQCCNCGAGRHGSEWRRISHRQ